MNRVSLSLLIVALMFSSNGMAAVPGQINFQGTLLDNASQLVNGSVDFDFALYDADTGGNQLWSEAQPGVTVSGGIYNVALGSVTPITPAMLAGSAVYLEITVDGDLLTPRQRLLAVPYALQAELAQDTASVNGAAAGFFSEILEHTDYDGQDIPNDDPLEGLLDTDGDGLANFIDPDNDNDSYTDDTELANGTGVNLATPTIVTFVNQDTGGASLLLGSDATFTATGSGFEPGLVVNVGTETPTPQNLTSTSFDVVAGATLSSGDHAVTATNLNGETTFGGTIIDVSVFKLVFTTRDNKAAALSRTAASADAFCATAAVNAGLPGTYIAWYSGPGSGAGPLDRMDPSGGPWHTLDGQAVASDIADLIDGSLDNMINIDEYGDDTGVRSVATNTFETGLHDPNSCAGSSPNQGRTGSTYSTGSSWSSNGPFLNCATGAQYFCFQQ